jgi:hypothetical protein
VTGSTEPVFHSCGGVMNIEAAFHSAMVDAINIFVRKVLKHKGYLTPDGEAAMETEEYLRLRNEIVGDLASGWSRFRFDSDGNIIGSYEDYFSKKQPPATPAV